MARSTGVDTTPPALWSLGSSPYSPSALSTRRPPDQRRNSPTWSSGCRAL